MNKISFKDKKKVAFVTSGGAVKAACFHIGVCLALERKGIRFNDTPRQKKSLPIQTYVGSSSGSIIATFLASGYSLDTIVDSFLDRPVKKSAHRLPKLHYRDLFKLATPNFKKYFHLLQSGTFRFTPRSFEGLLKHYLSFGGIFTTAGLEKYLRVDALPSNHFEDLSTELFIVGTQLDRPYKTIFCSKKSMKPNSDHHAFYENKVLISQAAAASTALPPIYQPYPITIGKEPIYYYDGEIKEPLSMHVAKDNGCDLIIGSYIHQSYHFHPAIGSLAHFGISAVIIQALYQAIEQKIHTSQRLWKTKKMALDTVHNFFKEHRLPDTKRKALCEQLEIVLNFDKHLDYLLIHPRPQDYRLFLADHFNLSKTHMIPIVNSGFRSALACLKNYDFN